MLAFVNPLNSYERQHFCLKVLHCLQAEPFLNDSDTFDNDVIICKKRLTLLEKIFPALYCTGMIGVLLY